MDVTKAGREFIRGLSSICGFQEELLVKVDEPTDERYGWVPTERPIAKYIEYGMIPLDKPPGPTSHEVVAWVKKLLGLRKAGHGGTLEPRRGAGIPQGHRCSAYSVGERNEDHRLDNAFFQRVRLRDAAS